MYFFPYCKFEVKSKRTPEAISSIVRLYTESIRYLAIERKKYFVGDIDETGFLITDSGCIENSSFVMRNSFNPIIQGKYIIDENGTTVIVSASLHWLISLFLLFAFGILFFAGFLPVLSKNPILAYSVFGIGILILYLFVMAGFNLGMKTTKRKLDILMKLIM